MWFLIVQVVWMVLEVFVSNQRRVPVSHRFFNFILVLYENGLGLNGNLAVGFSCDQPLLLQAGLPFQVLRHRRSSRSVIPLTSRNLLIRVRLTSGGSHRSLMILHTFVFRRVRMWNLVRLGNFPRGRNHSMLVLVDDHCRR
uniref:(northern house mosquito) hypothetical protein n=1 Tax=Culex pipiens TaxID=7175 RepID=A0A8D8FJ48_CULPI